ncbi:hypothetical protein JCM19538_3329 [Jejuia pallidilutea]|nr:hypothetical protein JCM19538_3329 [Jejuia pallidilutea]
MQFKTTKKGNTKEEINDVWLSPKSTDTTAVINKNGKTNVIKHFIILKSFIVFI